jgi:hypothetical protein
VAVDHEAGVGLLLAQDEVERAPDIRHLRRIERGLAIDGSVAGRGEQVVAASRRHLEDPGQQEHHVAARLGASGLDEAEMPRGDLGVDGQAELAQAPPFPPVPDELADGAGGFLRGRGSGFHAGKVHPGRAAPPLPRR